MVSIQNIPEMVDPFAEAESISPRITMPVVRMMATLRPM
jgi:hypothetical protein